MVETDLIARQGDDRQGGRALAHLLVNALEERCRDD
jgi:hypothetical protein